MKNKRLQETVERIKMAKHKSQWYNLRPVLGCAN